MKKITILFMAAFLTALTALTAHSAPLPREGEVSISVTIDAPQTAVRLWLPYPVSGKWQTISGVRVEGTFSSSAVYREKETGNLAMYAQWNEAAKEKTLSLSFDVSASERSSGDISGLAGSGGIPAEVEPYLVATEFIPTDGKVKEIADAVAGKKKGIESKARAVYDWVVENTFRDPDIKGCGTGDVERTLSVRGGKCVDISSVFVAIARAAGVPAREVFGLRLGKLAEEDTTGGYHCWAEFYLPGKGWVPVDPADVTKAMLAEKLDLEGASKYREYFYGNLDKYRIALATGGRGYYLEPRQDGGPINYFMYPYAEAGGKPLDWLNQQALKYRVVFKEKKE